MLRSAFNAHTDPLLKNLGILNLKGISKLQVGKFMYQWCVFGDKPGAFLWH